MKELGDGRSKQGGRSQKQINQSRVTSTCEHGEHGKPRDVELKILSESADRE